MAVYDCCSFFNENDIFEIRLNQHWDFVDKFIVVEAGETHTGLKKQLNFDHERFKPYADKIIYVSFDNFADTIEEFPEYYDALSAMLHDNRPEWIRDSYQNNYVFKVLNDIGAQDDDIVFWAPPDEMIRREAFELALERFNTTERFDVVDSSNRVKVDGIRPMFRFCLRFHVFKFNLLVSEQEVQPVITQFGNWNKLFPSLARDVSISTHEPILDGGWHFSYADDSNGERVLEKMKSWAHATDPGRGLNGARRMDATSAEQALQILSNEFFIKEIPMDRATHPNYVMDNLDKFKNYIYSK